MFRATLTLTTILAAAPALAATEAAAPASVPTVTGTYVEARTAEVFAGGCIMNSEAETMGRQAVLAWRVDRGAIGGVTLDGLSVVAALSGTHNLGMREMGGESPTLVKALMYVDERATDAQRDALVSMARTAIGDLAIRVVGVQAVPIAFERTHHAAAVQAGEARLDVEAHIHHDPSCGAMQWFHPLSRGAQAEVGLTKNQSFTGQQLGTRWQQLDKRSAFVGTFAF
ncbi:hypothetical protein TBR22_A52710 [Luteitalea sp. TBR-22]|uniref:DUF1326 domain-containing protein n=1 Tax=Luteitalea sp. TBR-22 TaxID=2802971 RepID=UPI001AF83595|nr:DUF1326 domain-containing protein [Luteitalea sp. TBR-22]BCS36034.1 hypothetical protein TBR22_A52710 [Luteitalea sp. TBR-22]